MSKIFNNAVGIYLTFSNDHGIMSGASFIVSSQWAIIQHLLELLVIGQPGALGFLMLVCVVM